MAKARQSRRPSRLGSAAGAAPKPDRVRPDDAGFPGLLAAVWREALAAPDVSTAVGTLLTLSGRVPADIQLRALRRAEECALQVLCGLTWRAGSSARPPAAGHPSLRGEAGEDPAFVGSIGLTTGGRVVVGVPSRGPLASEEALVGGVIRVPWSAAELDAYRVEFGNAAAQEARAVADCRQWLAAIGPAARDELLEELAEAARRTAPFVLYQEGRRYTNFRDRNTLTGKTLWPGHPDCALNRLRGVPPDLWADSDAVLVVCLGLLIRSAGFARIEEANGTQLTLHHVAELLERTRQKYNQIPGAPQVAPARGVEVEALHSLARALGEQRAALPRGTQLYREIHGALMHKIEKVAGPWGERGQEIDREISAQLRSRLPLRGSTLSELAADLGNEPDWLARPHGEFGTGLESLIAETVTAAVSAFAVDFAMSRGMRSLSALVEALRAQDWARIVGWELADFFCCVVPAPSSVSYFGDSHAHLADVTWSISARMQYNSWHFIAGNLPRAPEVLSRDYFVPPTIPDIAFYSDQHHHGHVAAQVRYSIRSPQQVVILDRAFKGFVDLRLLRCDGTPFAEQDLLTAHRASAFIAAATSRAAGLAAAGQPVTMTAFDSRWHWDTVTGGTLSAPNGRSSGEPPGLRPVPVTNTQYQQKGG